MQNLPVHWYEGLFLRPQHFQAAERYWSEFAQTSHQWDHPYYYGLHALEFSKEALANSQFQVHVLQARMPDGTLVNLELGQEPDRVDLKEAVQGLHEVVAQLDKAFEMEAVVRVYLAVPKLKLGRPNVDNNGSAGDARYVETSLSTHDETRGGDDQEIQFRNLNVRLLLSSQDLSGFDILPVAQIKRAGEGEATPQLDTTYIPPVLSIDAWPQLGRDTVRAIYDIIGQKIEVMSQQVLNRGIGLDSRDPGDAERILMLSQLNSAYSTLGVIAFAKGVHPFVAYTELCRIVGQLSIFAPQRRVSEVPAYDHEELQPIFSEIRLRIEALLNTVREYEYEQRYFVGAGMGMQVSLEPKWFHSDWQWMIGVNKGDLSRPECLELLSAGQLDWKLGSSRQVEVLFKNRMEGVQLTPVDRAIRALPTRQEWIYFEVPRTDAPAWRDVQETQSLAMRLKDSLILNLDRLQGKQKLIVSAHGRKAELEFALFAIPSQA